MEDKAIIFIPDISGFTKFVTHTEIQHSNHIISELIEVIINANDLNFEVSEIEGDAVLYYRFGEFPSIRELFLQSKKMFLEFHKYLNIIERDTVCQCGACQSASGLTLKFIAHVGEIKEVAIKNFKKLMGSDVILAHLLLKTSLNFSEYLLFTSNYLETQIERDGLDEWIEFKKHKESFDNFGEVNIEVIPFKELQKQIPAAEKKQIESNSNTVHDAAVTINAPILKVHELLIDNELKLKWVPGIKTIKSNSPINKVNSSHTCVFDNLEIHFVTLHNQREKNQIKYSESGELSSGLSFVSDYVLVEEDGKTKLGLNIIPGKIKDENLSRIKQIYRSQKLKLIIFAAKKRSQKNLNKFKEFVEGYTAE
ncbi:MAG: DUF2652 domain-containing protein [Ignavibacteriae bacterium]|nr:DUF2652 domain-containing protein [Ignavibacteriota bacterium]NOG98499.1 DUF2652 domain-containing protein [Ignavibacteriota bacterium]